MKSLCNRCSNIIQFISILNCRSNKCCMTRILILFGYISFSADNIWIKKWIVITYT